MDVILPLPDSWHVEVKGGRRIVHVADSRITLAIEPLIPRPEDPRRWAQQRIREDRAPGTTLEVGPVADATTDDGWQLVVIETRGSDGSAHVHCFYSFHVWMGLVAISAPTSADLESHRAALLDLVGKARPNFGTGPVAISQLWAGIPTASSGRSTP